jgi:mediator of RNA polymerase II transcription subunit 18
MNQPGDVNNLEPITLSCLVELSVVAPTGQEQIGEDMKNFAEQLKPYPL